MFKPEEFVALGFEKARVYDMRRLTIKGVGKELESLHKSIGICADPNCDAEAYDYEDIYITQEPVVHERYYQDGDGVTMIKTVIKKERIKIDPKDISYKPWTMTVNKVCHLMMNCFKVFEGTELDFLDRVVCDKVTMQWTVLPHYSKQSIGFLMKRRGLMKKKNFDTEVTRLCIEDQEWLWEQIVSLAKQYKKQSLSNKTKKKGK